MNIRVKFVKRGASRFISHLDTQRYFQRLFRRAGVDMEYSAGFSPHPLMSFALPLGLGQESEGEYLDVKLRSYPGDSKLVDLLNAAGLPDMEVILARQIPDDAPKAMSVVAAAGWELRLSGQCLQAMDPEEFLHLDKCIVLKKTKSGETETDIRPGVYELARTEAGYYMLLDASSGGFLQSGLVAQSLKIDCPYRIIRKELYCKGTKEDGREWVGMMG